jgi:hypothetical protein
MVFEIAFRVYTSSATPAHSSRVDETFPPVETVQGSRRLHSSLTLLRKVQNLEGDMGGAVSNQKCAEEGP